MPKLKGFYLSILVTSITLSGCAFLFGINPDKNHVNKYTTQPIESNFSLSGRFAINNKDRHQYGNFTWNKHGNFEELDFNTPLGQTIGKIIVESNIASLITKDKTYTGEDLDTAQYQQLGFTLPITQLHYWILGTPLPKLPIDSKLDNGFIQLGWKIEYLELNQQSRPKIVQLTKDKLIIKLLVNYN